MPRHVSHLASEISSSFAYSGVKKSANSTQSESSGSSSVCRRTPQRLLTAPLGEAVVVVGEESGAGSRSRDR